MIEFIEILKNAAAINIATGVDDDLLKFEIEGKLVIIQASCNINDEPYLSISVDVIDQK